MEGNNDSLPQTVKLIQQLLFDCEIIIKNKKDFLCIFSHLQCSETHQTATQQQNEPLKWVLIQCTYTCISRPANASGVKVRPQQRINSAVPLKAKNTNSSLRWSATISFFLFHTWINVNSLGIPAVVKIAIAAVDVSHSPDIST